MVVHTICALVSPQYATKIILTESAQGVPLRLDIAFAPGCSAFDVDAWLLLILWLERMAATAGRMAVNGRCINDYFDDARTWIAQTVLSGQRC